MKHSIRKILNLKIIKNKYFLATLIFLIFVLFLSQSNIFRLISNLKYNSDLKKQINFYTNQIDSISHILEKLKKDKIFFEKFVREKFFLKEKDEVLIYVIDSSKFCNN